MAETNDKSKTKKVILIVIAIVIIILACLYGCIAKGKSAPAAAQTQEQPKIEQTAPAQPAPQPAKPAEPAKPAPAPQKSIFPETGDTLATDK